MAHVMPVREHHAKLWCSAFERDVYSASCKNEVRKKHYSFILGSGCIMPAKDSYQELHMKVLLVEDERDLADAVANVLRKNYYAVDHAYDGEYGLDCALSGVYDFIVLDILLPKKNGLHVLKELRGAGIKTPVLMLTALGEVRDRVTGLDCGADDYLSKPFHIDELLARLRALSRRKSELLEDGVIMFGSLRFSPHTLMLTCDGKETGLTLKESQLLEVLIANKGRFISKDAIIEKLWSYDSGVYDSHVESQVSLLRRKLAAAGGALRIKSSRGVGYRLEEAASSE